MSPNRRIFLNVFATYGRSLYALVCGLFTARWVLAALGKQDFGLYGVVGGMTVFIAFFNNLLSTATSRFYAYAEGRAKKSAADGDADAGLEECQQWFSTAVLLHMVLSIALIVIGYPLGFYAVEHWLTIPIERLDACLWVFRYVCVSCFIAMINVPFQAMYTAKQYIAELTVYSFIQTTANIMFVYFMIKHPGDWLARYALWMCLVVIVPQILICIRAVSVFKECRFVPKYAWSKSRIFQLTTFAFWQSFGCFGSLLRGQGIQILVNKYFEPSYNASMNIANQVSYQSQTLSGAMQGAFAPAIIAAYGEDDMERMRVLSYRTCKFGMLASLVFVMPLALELRYVLDLWLVSPPPYATELCWLILLSSILDKSATGHMLAVSAVGKIALYQGVLGGILVLTLPIAWVFVASGMGFVSVGVALALTMAFCAAGRVWFAKKLAEMSSSYWFVAIIVPICAVSLVSGLVAFSSRLFIPIGFYRLILTTIIFESLFLPLSWFIILTRNERSYLVTRISQIVFLSACKNNG